jgi:hypothetical protein
LIAADDACCRRFTPVSRKPGNAWRASRAWHERRLKETRGAAGHLAIELMKVLFIAILFRKAFAVIFDRRVYQEFFPRAAKSLS